MNKYLKQSMEAQERMRRRKACESKVAFATKALAFQKSQSCYQCRFCGQWHRATLANRVQHKFKMSPRKNRPRNRQ